MPTKTEYRDGIIEAITALGPTIFLTVVFNYPSSHRAGEKTVVELLKRIERTALGKRWDRFPTALRLRAYGFFEGEGRKLHCHLVIAPGVDPRMQEALLEQSSGLWRWLSKTGHSDVQLIENPDAVAIYVTKYLDVELRPDRWFVYP